jgi:hypothetical protein
LRLPLPGTSASTVSVTPVPAPFVAAGRAQAQQAISQRRTAAWVGSVGGLIGAAIASQAISEPERIKLYMESEHIDLPAIVRNQ